MTPPLSHDDIQEAVAVLKNGGVVVYPTETAYGLAADATNERAVERVRAIKGREAWKTPPLIVADKQMAERYVMLSSVLNKLVHELWPGPLTIVAPVSDFGRQELAQGVIRDGTVALRVSSHKIASALSRELGKPIVATSANVAGEPTCFDIVCVRTQFASQLLQPDFFLDEGPLPECKPSTLIAECDGEVVILREGAIEIKYPYVA
ncbi:threonylcarbamoyl-AMP synthase [Candidatus Uhrbacteria bacterium]|nr:threonylcarbamoyl-AMP synthase [Candidatus Uhrbacteria bacterium]